MTATTATQILLREQADRQKNYAMKTLLIRLERWTRAIPFAEGDEMPDHRVHFMTEPDEGPGKTIDDAIKSNPSLWADALPRDVVIIPKASAKQLGISDDILEYLASMGQNIVDTHAARHHHMVEEEAERKRGKR